jgi:hypothetical protein
MLRFLKRNVSPTDGTPVPPLEMQAAVPQTFKTKIDELHIESLALQKRFLDVVVQIRENAKSEEAIDEVLLYKRDVLYKKFNKILNLHRRLRNYIEQHAVPLSSEITDDIWGKI